MKTTDLTTLSNHAITMIAIQKVQDFLSRTYVFRYNENTHRIVYKKISDAEEFHYLSDYELNLMLKDIEDANVLCSKDLLRKTIFASYVQKFNPFAGYLNNLPEWDGIDYVSLLASSIITTNKEYWQSCLKRWLVAMIASLKEERVISHTAIIFGGAHGIGKARWFHSIIPSELQEFIVPFTRITNKKQFFKDFEANGRCLCFEVEHINTQHGIPLDQLSAQLLSLYETGFQYWFNEEEIALANKKNAQFKAVSVEEKVLISFFETCNGSSKCIYANGSNSTGIGVEN